MQKTIFLAAMLCSISVFGQSTFHKTYSGVNFSFIAPSFVSPVSGGGYFSLFSNNNDGCAFARLDETGEIIWQKRYKVYDYLNHGIEVNGGFLILGDTAINSGNLGYSILSKISHFGSIIWSKVLRIPNGNVRSTGLISVPGGFLVSGQIALQNDPQNRTFLTKLNENGNTIWSKYYYESGINNNFKVQKIEGDTLYACGNIRGNGCFIRINSNTGELIGYTTLGKIYSDDFFSLKATQDNNFILAGYTTTTDSEEPRPWVMKVNRLGQTIWSKIYYLPGTKLYSQITNANDGGFVLAMDGSSYAILLKIDDSGNPIWAYNYAAGQQYASLESVMSVSDGGFVALGGAMILKTDNNGKIAYGCCPQPIDFQIETFAPPIQQYPLSVFDWISIANYNTEAHDANYTVKDFCETPMTSVIEQILLCKGDSVEINGVFFQAPQVLRDTIQNLSGGCDTVRVINLVQLPLPFRVESIPFCPGTSVVVNGVTYSQPDTFAQILPATVGCDTEVVYLLYWKTLPKKYETTAFCPGDTVFINGIGYQFPGILPNPDTLPGSAIGCDTLLYQVLAYPVEPSSVSVYCPADMMVSTAPSTPLVVNYLLPSSTSDCTCPDLYVSLTQGLSSGAVFPVGNTQVCYSAYDICGASNACCFEVKVVEEAVCDAKESGCIQYELLGISVDAGQNKTYRIRVTNDCASALSYTAFQVPNGITALAPAQNSTYTSPNAIEYTVRNPNHSPFHSIRFKPVNSGLASGQSDVFEYTLPAQASPVFIKAATRLASGAFYEATLNTFGCSLQANVIADRTFNRPVFQPTLRVFPNPSSGELFLDLTGLENGIAQVRVLNAHGQEMAQTLLPTGQGVQFFPLAHSLTDGLYFFELKSENGERQTARFVLHR
ncbi:MAG: T9SS type A sorting domain-containing protein [Lewinellaceae bacterium]|nr:T9SS type A sorting domain-containing protein [Lewinellaceae bacterium]